MSNSNQNYRSYMKKRQRDMAAFIRHTIDFSAMEVAVMIGCSVQAVGHWRSGRVRTPRPEIHNKMINWMQENANTNVPAIVQPIKIEKPIEVAVKNDEIANAISRMEDAYTCPAMNKINKLAILRFNAELILKHTEIELKKY